jgi:hypothetical protein
MTEADRRRHDLVLEHLRALLEHAESLRDLVEPADTIVAREFSRHRACLGTLASILEVRVLAHAS